MRWHIGIERIIIIHDQSEIHKAENPQKYELFVVPQRLRSEELCSAESISQTRRIIENFWSARVDGAEGELYSEALNSRKAAESGKGEPSFEIVSIRRQRSYGKQRSWTFEGLLALDKSSQLVEHTQELEENDDEYEEDDFSA